LFAALSSPSESTALPAAIDRLTPFQEVLADYRTQGLSLRAHPISFLREQLDKRRCVPHARLSTLKTGRWTRIGGIVLLRQRPGTAKGITFATLEDETGVANIVIHPAIWQRYRDVARASKAWIVEGRLEVQGKIVHLVAARLIDLTSELGEIALKSRDFQ
jgi:error-prone DNA polymerase